MSENKQAARERKIARRDVLTSGAAASLLAAAPRRAFAVADRPYRAAVIGHTGRGNYGHGIDTVWQDVPGVQLAAVADADPDGLKKAKERLGGIRGFADYREMLAEVKPEFVGVGPRWLDQHRDMVVAAAEGGARGIYLEKPMCRSLEEADAMVAACEKHGTKLAIATQTRYSPKLPALESIIRDGTLGQLLEIRARGKEDRRGGGEDLWVLGTHVLDLMQHLGGRVESCSATIYDQGELITRKHVKPGNEGIGPLAGDEVHATFRLEGGVTGYFDSVRHMRGDPSRFGIRFYGTKGVVELFNTGYLPTIHLLAESAWSSGRGGQWVAVSSQGVGQPEPLAPGGLHEGNELAVKDLIAAVEENRQPLANAHEARKTIEMIAAIFDSHRVGGPVRLPLENRQNPLSLLS